MARNGSAGVRLKKCPKCGGEIEISFLNQYSYVHKLTKSGRISKRYTKEDNGTMEVSVAGCRTCEDGYFWDFKYSGEGRL